VRSGIVAALTIGIAITGYAWIARAQGNGNDKEIAPNGKGHYTLDHPENGNGNGQAGRGKPVAYPMVYHGGPVMTNVAGANAYYIWYGNWSGNSATDILTSFITSIGPSDWFNINSTYSDASGAPVKNVITLKGVYTPGYTHGTSLSDAAVQAIVADTNPTDTNGVYFVLTSADVNASSGFCTQYCGWHTHATINGKDIKYSFVGNPDRCPSACAAQTTSPNGNAGADGMASIIAHELAEAVTDPDLNAWYDQRGYENADKCAWTFGPTYKVANGASANMKLSDGRDYLIQQNWVRNTGCAVKYP
jgi:hypothetical protein